MGITQSGASLLSALANKAGKTLTLMTVTDSWGHGNGQPDRLDGFRLSLERRLLALGRSVRMIGTQHEQRTDQTVPPTVTDSSAWLYSAHHEGHGGEKTSDAAAALASRAATAGVGWPDLALIRLGTNDLAVYGAAEDALTQTRPQSLALMTAALTSLVTQFFAHGCQRIFVCDLAHLAVPSVSSGALPTANSLCDDWNAYLDAHLSDFGSRVVPVNGLRNLTAADFIKANLAGDGHPNTTTANTIGVLCAETIVPYVEPAPSRTGAPITGNRAQPQLTTTATTDGLSQTLAGWKPPGAGSFCLCFDFTPTSLPSGVHNLVQYADAVANGFAVRSNGATIEVNIANATAIAGWPLAVGVPTRVVFWADAATGWIALALNGVIVNRYLLTDAWNITVSQAMYLGYVTPATTPGCPGVYARVEMHSGSALPVFADQERWILADARECARIPGLTAEWILAEGTGAPVESLSAAAATLVGGASWAVSGAYPRPWEQGAPLLLDGKGLGNASSLTVGASAPAAGLSVDLTSAVGGMSFPSISYAALLALSSPPKGAKYYCNDATLGVDVYNAGTPSAPVWRPVGGGVICSEVGGFVSSTNYYQGPANTGLGVTAAAGTARVIVRRYTNFSVTVGEIFGCCTASLAAGCMIILQNATTPLDSYKADVTNVIQSVCSVSYWQSVLNALVTTGTANGARGNLLDITLVFGVGTSILYVNGVPGSTATTVGYVETNTRVGLGCFGIDGSSAFSDGAIVGAAVSTSSQTAAQVQAGVADVGRLGPRQALLNTAGLTYAYVLPEGSNGAAPSTIATVTASGLAGGGGPTLTKTGALTCVPFVASAWGLAA